MRSRRISRHSPRAFSWWGMSGLSRRDEMKLVFGALPLACVDVADLPWRKGRSIHSMDVVRYDKLQHLSTFLSASPSRYRVQFQRSAALQAPVLPARNASRSDAGRHHSVRPNSRTRTACPTKLLVHRLALFQQAKSGERSSCKISLCFRRASRNLSA